MIERYHSSEPRLRNLNLGLIAACALSAFTHVAVYSTLPLAAEAKTLPPPAHVTFQIHEPPPAPEPEPIRPEEPAPPPKPDPPLPSAAKPRAKAAEAAPTPAVVEPPKVVDLRGVTLTNDTGAAAWASVVGDGSPLGKPQGPVGQGARPSALATAAPATAKPASITLVPLADLSTRPVPPELASLLRDRYPEQAKLRGISGSAKVQARIDADGRVRVVQVESETFVGFGDACRKTLLGSQWGAPLDKQGKRVATQIHYTCRFVVGA